MYYYLLTIFRVDLDLRFGGPPKGTIAPILNARPKQQYICEATCQERSIFPLLIKILLYCFDMRCLRRLAFLFLDGVRE